MGKIKITRVRLICAISILTLVIAFLAFLGGILHLVLTVSASMDNMFGVFFLMALILFNLLIYLNDRVADNNDKRGMRLHRRGCHCLAAMIGGLLALVLLNLLVAIVYSSNFDRLIFGGIDTIYFVILILGAVMACETLAAVRSGYPFQQPQQNHGVEKKTLFKKTLTLICYLLLIGGTVNIYFLLGGDSSLFFESAPQFIETFLSGFSLFHAFILLSLAVLLIKLQRRQAKAPVVFAGLLGLLCFITYFSPLLTLPKTCREAEREFEGIFGKSALEQFDLVGADNFLKAPFSLPAYFFGLPPGDYRYERDIVFYRGDSGIDEGLTLHYDVFMPPENVVALPGRGTALIRIHGGGWISGNKGFTNMLQVNKYFASRGYTVFDVQYGLTDLIRLTVLQSYLAPPEMVGPYTLDDMVRHLGIFTRYLADHAAAYDIDPESIFISGGSAGGHLATAVALALSRGGYSEIFGDTIKIKGYLPLYPAFKTSFLPVIGETAEWIDVGLLVDGKSPPCIIYQGTRDGMVSYNTAERFQEIYRAAGNEKCALLKFNCAGHASDFYFPGYFNQIWIYYSERFMALYR